jgi:hypothetical protein
MLFRIIDLRISYVEHQPQETKIRVTYKQEYVSLTKITNQQDKQAIQSGWYTLLMSRFTTPGNTMQA